MNTLRSKLRSCRGFSLLEVLIALTLTGIITAAILRAYVTQHRNYMVQDDVTAIQQSARASIDELARHIRMAGNRLPAGVPAIVASNTNPDTITLHYRVDNCETYLSDPMPQPSSELKCGTDITCFYEGQWVYIFEPDSGGGEWFEITQVQGAARHIQHNTMSLSKRYGADAMLISMERVKFFIDDTTDPDHPRLMVQYPGMAPAIYADNISNLQFMYHLTNGSVVDEPVLVEDIRQIEILVTGRSERPDPEMPENPYRERTYSSAVNLRNHGI